ncbi:copper amine oxidase N-terminal domain-containing protein [Candidatus Pristimantibacillus sp. PTI5]|uniref:copper amine oxidase N-terminal domain-containing protein n=1 Tax=Candidatus Pristimantibacillus sp. PTI5 TaxID=3400422 RepID=UPI003B018E05
MPKKIISLLFCFLLAFQISNVVSAAQPALKISVDGQVLSLSQSPIVLNGTTMVPIAPIFKKLGLSLELTGTSLKGSKKGIVIRMNVGSKVASVNGVSVILNEPVKIINNNTMVPLRFISDSIGAAVSSANGTILISNNNSKTMYDINLPILVSGNYVRNLTNTDFLQLVVVDFFYNPSTKTVSQYDFFSSVIGFERSSTKSYNNFNVAKTEHNGEIYIGSAIKSLIDYDNNIQGNTNYSKIKAHYNTNSYLEKVRALIKSEKDASNASLKKELQANNNKPLKVTGVEITYNSIDVPEVNLTIKNLTTKTIVAYEMKVSCYDDFDRPVYRYFSSSNLFLGISQGNSLASGESQTDTWTLNLYDLATQVKNVTITAVKFSDGTSWKL